ncbi:hypothetical protein PFISCL1PPCAC_12044, partial [Pristionchus fissidentatus]
MEGRGIMDRAGLEYAQNRYSESFQESGYCTKATNYERKKYKYKSRGGQEVSQDSGVRYEGSGTVLQGTVRLNICALFAYQLSCLDDSETTVAAQADGRANVDDELCKTCLWWPPPTSRRCSRRKNRARSCSHGLTNTLSTFPGTMFSSSQATS